MIQTKHLNRGQNKTIKQKVIQMPARVFLKPNPEQKIDGKPVKVYDPAHHDFLPESGRFVILNPYWVNRLRYNEVLRANENAETPEPNEPNDQTDEEIVSNFKSKKEVISFAREKFGDEFADMLDEKKKLDELKAIVITELNK